MSEILLGNEVGTTKPVHMPLHHTGFTGMTQKAGKTTAIEGCAMRSVMRAITFRTKRGETGFETTGVVVKPYFLERSDWQYVESLIEATLRENQRFNRSWIIRACEGTKTLNDVWRNIKEAKKKARGLALSVYTNLNAYFQIVVPEIRRYDFSRKLEIAKTGVSVMNLIGMPTEVQALVIRSTIDQIYKKERNIIVVIPEAWKFIGIIHTPVTYAAERLIREGASVGIYLFLDSQDISGINSRIRSQIDNWILGRQKYEHEIERTLKAIPVKNKPTKEQIQTLKLGHFYAACDVWVKKIYFLPWNIPEEIGVEVAKGVRTPESVKKMLEERRLKFRKEDDDLKWKEKFEEEHRIRKKLEKTLGQCSEDLKKLQTVKALRKQNEEMRNANLDKYHGELEKFKKRAEFLEAKYKGLTDRYNKMEGELKLYDEFRSIFRRIFHGMYPKAGFKPGVEGPSEVSVSVEQPALILKKQRHPLDLSQDKLEGKIAVVYAEGLPLDKWFTTTDVVKAFISHGWKRDPRIGPTLDKFCQWGFFEKHYAGRRPEYRVKLSPEIAREKGLLKEVKA